MSYVNVMLFPGAVRYGHSGIFRQFEINAGVQIAKLNHIVHSIERVKMCIVQRSNAGITRFDMINNYEYSIYGCKWG